MHNRIQNLFRNEIKQLKRKINLLQDRLEQFKKRQSLLDKGAETNRRNAEPFTKWIKSYTKWQDQSRDELEQIAKMRRIKNYKKLLKKVLSFLLKSKRSLAELFNNNPDNDKISEIKKSSIN